MLVLSENAGVVIEAALQEVFDKIAAETKRVIDGEVDSSERSGVLPALLEELASTANAGLEFTTREEVLEIVDRVCGPKPAVRAIVRDKLKQ